MRAVSLDPSCNAQVTVSADYGYVLFQSYTPDRVRTFTLTGTLSSLAAAVKNMSYFCAPNYGGPDRLVVEASCGPWRATAFSNYQCNLATMVMVGSPAAYKGYQDVTASLAFVVAPCNGTCSIPQLALVHGSITRGQVTHQ